MVGKKSEKKQPLLPKQSPNNLFRNNLYEVTVPRTKVKEQVSRFDERLVGA